MRREKIIEPVVWTACTTFTHPSSLPSSEVIDYISSQIGEHRSFIRSCEDYINAFFDLTACTHGAAEVQTERIVDKITSGDIGGIVLKGLFVAPRQSLSTHVLPEISEITIQRLRKHRRKHAIILPPLTEYPQPASITDLDSRRETTA